MGSGNRCARERSDLARHVRHGVVEVDLAGGRTRRILHQPGVSRSLVNDTICALYRDRSGGIWVGTTAGIGRLETNGDAVFNVVGDNRSGIKLSGADVKSLAVAVAGRIWAGQFAGGIDILDLDNKRVATLAPNRNQPETALPAAMVSALLQWPRGDMFIGTGGGLYRANSNGGHMERVVLPGRTPTAGVEALTMEAERLWIGSAEDGLWTLTPDAERGRAERYHAGMLTDIRIVCMTAGAHNDLWIGTRSGLNRLDLLSRTIEGMHGEPADPASLASGYISALVLDHAGRLWVGTMGGGVHLLVTGEPNGPKFRRIGLDQGLPNGNVDGLLADATGRIWVATDGGIAVIDPVTLAVRALTRADGASLSAYWVNSSAASPTGELLFGGTGSGLTVICPERLRTWLYRPPIVVTEARVGGRAVLVRCGGDPASERELLMTPDAKSLAVEFSALDHSAPDTIITVTGCGVSTRRGLRPIRADVSPRTPTCGPASTSLRCKGQIVTVNGATRSRLCRFVCFPPGIKRDNGS
jgi:hypothetical protein